MSVDKSRNVIIFAAMLATIAFHAPVLVAQTLEEIVVTAQRREQSLQEVPISIEAYTSLHLRRQGYRDLEALASLNPGIIALPQQDQTVIMIRGFGTTGNALTLEQATPIFLDGIHFGRSSQAKNAYLDLERVEILKGPQPVFFGNNATAGAFNIQSKRPTPTWEGDLDLEIGNNNTQQVSFGVGGPLNDRWGIRVAAKHETTDGYLIDVIDQQPFPHQEDWGGRVTLQWTPSDTFTATAKMEVGDINAGSEGKQICLTGGDLIFGRKGPLSSSSKDGKDATIGEPFAVWLDPPLGEGTEIPHLAIPTTDGDCFKSNLSRSNEGPYYDVPNYIRQTAARDGMLDIRKAGQAWMEDDEDVLAGPQNAFSSILGGERIQSVNSYLDLNWVLDNGVEVDWLTGFSKYDRETSEENFDSPYYENNQIRNINFDQWSTEFRLTSATGGSLEWMVGTFIQDTTLDNVTGNLRATVRRGMRMNKVWEDVRWNTFFATATLNFLDGKASLDLGGRYADIDKMTLAHGHGRQWLVNEEPVEGSKSGAINVVDDLSEHSVYLPYDASKGLWYYPYRANREVPENWKGTQGANVVGLTRPFTAARDSLPDQGPMGGKNYPGAIDGKDGDFGGQEFDPQVTLRFRPNDDHSLFFRWAQSFKLGGFDTGQTTIPDSYDDFAFESERTESFEIGSKGSLMGGRGRYDVTVFENVFKSLQLQASTGNLDDPNANINAGKQRVRGVEFSIDFAATDQLSVSFAGAIMNGEMVDFFNAPCNRAEREISPDCDPETLTINRTGEAAPYTPDWGFTGEVNHTMPVLDGYEVTTNVRGYVSDGYFTDKTSFTKHLAWGTHGDVNLSVGFGDVGQTWRIAAWGRNLLEANRSYFPDQDYGGKNQLSINVSPSNFKTYGVKFEYNYR